MKSICLPLSPLRLLLSTFCFLRSADCLLPTAYCLLLDADCLLPLNEAGWRGGLEGLAGGPGEVRTLDSFRKSASKQSNPPKQGARPSAFS